jgi:hypothetical protein
VYVPFPSRNFDLNGLAHLAFRRIIRFRQSRVGALPTKPFSFALKLRNTSFHFSYATYFRPSVDSSTPHGLSKTVYMLARHAQLKRLSNKWVAYVIFLVLCRQTVYSHLSCSQIGTAIFTFVIGAHTFSLLFLRRKYSGRTSYIILFLSWGLLLLEMCIENFVLARQGKKGPFYGIAGYWCWITPMHPVERFTTSYLYMFFSAACSFILYSLVFFRLRGNISVSTRYKISFHRRPKVMPGTTIDGIPIQTDDRRVESHLTTLAKQMLWYPIAYSILVLPMAASRFSTFSGASVPFWVTIFTASVFMLHGFINTVLFCTTRDILPGSWRQRFGLYTSWSTRPDDAHPPSRVNDTWYTATRTGTVRTGTATVPAVRSVGVEKDIETNYEAERSISHIKFGSSTSPTPLPPTHGSNGQRANLHDYHIRRFSAPALHDTSTTVCFELDEDDGDSILSVGNHSTPISRKDGREVSQHAGRASRGLENGVHRPATAPGAPSVYPFSTALPANTDTRPYDDVRNIRQSRPSPFLRNWRFWRQR